MSYMAWYDVARNGNAIPVEPISCAPYLFALGDECGEVRPRARRGPAAVRQALLRQPQPRVDMRGVVERVRHGRRRDVRGGGSRRECRGRLLYAGDFWLIFHGSSGIFYFVVFGR